MHKIVALLLLSLFSQLSFAFGGLGHELVCDIAWREMNDNSRTEVIKMLKHTQYATFAESCVWADRVRGNNDYKHLKPFHYVNVEKNATEVVSGAVCEHKGCVVDAIAAYSKVLAGEALTAREQSLYTGKRHEALMLLGHFTGDVHQPLHVSYAADWGGNKIKVRYQGHNTNLHKVWDSGLIKDGIQAPWREAGAELAEDISDTDRTKWHEPAPRVWANESLVITRSIYRALPRRGNPKKLKSDYFDTHFDTVRTRILTAGVRLAHTLDRVLDQPPAPMDTPTSVTLYGGEYYEDADGLSGQALHKALNTLISAHEVLSYKQVWDALDVIDEDPLNSHNVILLYTGRSQPKSTKYRGGRDNDAWNREHVWAKSHGFPKKRQAAYTDVHHLRPADTTVNSSRGNKDFDAGGEPHKEVLGAKSDRDSFEPPDAVKGDVARMLFYMAVAYDGRQHKTPDLTLLVEDSDDKSPTFGHLCTLLKWHNTDAVSAWERLRNDRIFDVQDNRNPFIDHPEYAQEIWADRCP